ncbi:pentapeptide repeat-containing protein, partial [Paraburkholderia sediminicola]|uniref:pentapeptide repeat-containing protein n=1 Tax=Paraburkholderia sediminicola TaxID=458836 RepID=UPI0038BD9880
HRGTLDYNLFVNWVEQKICTVDQTVTVDQIISVIPPSFVRSAWVVFGASDTVVRIGRNLSIEAKFRHATQWNGFSFCRRTTNQTSPRLNYSGISLWGRDLRDWDLRNLDLTGAQLGSTDLHGVNFTGTDLTRADFILAQMEVYDEDWKAAKKRGVNFNHAIITFCDEHFVGRTVFSHPEPPVENQGLD